MWGGENLDICSPHPAALHGKKNKVFGPYTFCSLRGETYHPMGHRGTCIKQSSVWAEECFQVPSLVCICLNQGCSLECLHPIGVPSWRNSGKAGKFLSLWRQYDECIHNELVARASPRALSMLPLGLPQSAWISLLKENFNHLLLKISYQWRIQEALDLKLNKGVLILPLSVYF